MQELAPLAQVHLIRHCALASHLNWPQLAPIPQTPPLQSGMKLKLLAVAVQVLQAVEQQTAPLDDDGVSVQKSLAQSFGEAALHSAPSGRPQRLFGSHARLSFAHCATVAHWFKHASSTADEPLAWHA